MFINIRQLRKGDTFRLKVDHQIGESRGMVGVLTNRSLVTLIKIEKDWHADPLNSDFTFQALVSKEKFTIIGEDLVDVLDFDSYQSAEN